MKYKNIKLMPDYECWPLWDMDNLGDIDPKELLITETLQEKIENWAKKFDSILDWDDPGNSGGFVTEDEEKLFAEEGWVILEELRKELPDTNIIAKSWFFEKYPQG